MQPVRTDLCYSLRQICAIRQTIRPVTVDFCATRQGKFLCDPSQRGDLPLPLQPQNETTPVSSASNFIGENADPLCDPSQNGCLVLIPQEHHQ